MKHFFLVTRDFSDEKQKLINQIELYLNERGATLEVSQNPEDGDHRLLEVPKDAECIITVGGDGTLIRAAQNTFDLDLPLIGINQGHLGYLCDLDENNLFSSLDMLLADEYEEEERMMLAGWRVVDGVAPHKHRALNDIVITSVAGLEMITLEVYVNDKRLYTLNCDGMIFSTPTGSTAYNLSANGPLVDPHTKLIVLTPINPHTLNSRSIILGADDVISVIYRNRYNTGEGKVIVCYDGVPKSTLHENEKMVLHQSSAVTKMIQIENQNFLERIRTKLQEM